MNLKKKILAGVKIGHISGVFICIKERTNKDSLTLKINEMYNVQPNFYKATYILSVKALTNFIDNYLLQEIFT